MKEIKIFEVFSGIGSQIKALNLISKENNFKVKSLGFIEWYIDAIIAYQIINNSKILQKDKKHKKEDIIDKLSSLELSSDSKKPVTKNFFKNLSEEKLRNIFPYFTCLLNKEFIRGGGMIPNNFQVI
ncbi:hypothetical protein N8G13_00230 [Mycoplasma zalophi]|uniref:DNA (cytosine-5-)-methyltransferase N-terminal subunit n=1 Tax=Mycoplasma zalophi TaxID=191287 RepID=UPI0021C921ED|nr:hypothetical protein [Mycoplasma zalophi]MCU4116896.1 hypothetical protein [Mycoplasma zalophi]